MFSGSGNSLAIAIKIAQRVVGKSVWSCTPLKCNRSKKCLGWMGFGRGKELGARLLGMLPLWEGKAVISE